MLLKFYVTIIMPNDFVNDMAKRYVSVIHLGSECIVSPQLENHATQKKHHLEETWKLIVRNKFESSSEIFKGHFKEMRKN